MKKEHKPNQKYDTQKVIEVMAEYMAKTELEKIPMEELYEKIVSYAKKEHSKVKMPKFAQARKIIIKELTEQQLYDKDSQLTSETAYKLKDIYLYYDETKIEDVLHHEYEITTYGDSIIVCTFNLPPQETIEALTVGIGKENKKTTQWAFINTIGKICNKIKKQDTDNILAVIPECNRMNYINSNGCINHDLDELPPSCNSLCAFIKDSPQGHELLKKMNLPHFLTDIIKSA